MNRYNILLNKKSSKREKFLKNLIKTKLSKKDVVLEIKKLKLTDDDVLFIHAPEVNQEQFNNLSKMLKGTNCIISTFKLEVKKVNIKGVRALKVESQTRTKKLKDILWSHIIESEKRKKKSSDISPYYTGVQRAITRAKTKKTFPIRRDPYSAS